MFPLLILYSASAGFSSFGMVGPEGRLPAFDIVCLRKVLLRRPDISYLLSRIMVANVTRFSYFPSQLSLKIQVMHWIKVNDMHHPRPK